MRILPEGKHSRRESINHRHADSLGPTLVAAFVTQDPINFYEQTLDERDANGNIIVAFTTLSPVATRAITIAPAWFFTATAVSRR
jgi:hypothetical protein